VKENQHGRLKPEIRSSKSKIRKKSEARSPKEQILCGAAAHFSERPAEGGSDFGLLSDFADSDFGFRFESFMGLLLLQKRAEQIYRQRQKRRRVVFARVHTSGMESSR
jgi:hypothetical protein